MRRVNLLRTKAATLLARLSWWLSPPLHQINVEERGYDWMAWLNGDPRFWGAGDNIREALGSAVLNHYDLIPNGVFVKERLALARRIGDPEVPLEQLPQEERFCVLKRRLDEVKKLDKEAQS